MAALDHPVTRAAYGLLVERDEVGRDEATEALGVARSVAAFHLDKLVEVGLATVRFERLSGRSGPGAGRTAKVYRRSSPAIELSLPARRYDLAGGLLAEAVERSSLEGVRIDQALRDAAVETGRRIGEAALAAAGRQPSQQKRREALLRVLEHHGYEPHVRSGEIVLANCPFHVLAEEHRALVCGMNLDLLTGVVEGIGGTGALSPRLAPEPGSCCVRMRAS